MCFCPEEGIWMPLWTPRKKMHAEKGSWWLSWAQMSKKQSLAAISKQGPPTQASLQGEGGPSCLPAPALQLLPPSAPQRGSWHPASSGRSCPHPVRAAHLCPHQLFTCRVALFRPVRTVPFRPIGWRGFGVLIRIRTDQSGARARDFCQYTSSPVWL